MAAGKSTWSRFNIVEAKARFAERVQKAMLGEEVIIAKGQRLRPCCTDRLFSEMFPYAEGNALFTQEGAPGR